MPTGTAARVATWWSGLTLFQQFLTATTPILLGAMLGISGRVFPSTAENVTLVAEFASGEVVRGETAIASHGQPIRRLALERPVRPLPDALQRRGVTTIELDRDAPGDLARALGSGFDALIDVAAYGPKHGRQLIAVQSLVGGLVVISSSSVYRDQVGRTLDEAAQTVELPDVYKPNNQHHAVYADYFGIFEKLSTKLFDEFEAIGNLQQKHAAIDEHIHQKIKL